MTSLARRVAREWGLPKGKKPVNNYVPPQPRTVLDPLTLRALRALAAREGGEIVIEPEELEIEGRVAIRRLPDGAMMVRIAKEDEL